MSIYKKSVCVFVAGLSLAAVARDVDDQIRYTMYLPHHHDVLMEMGFNFFSWGKGKYDFKSGKASIPSPDYERETLRRLEAEGAEVILNYSVNRNRVLMAKYPRVGQDGKPLTRSMMGREVRIIDPAAPGCTEEMAAGAKALAQAYAALGVRSFAGFRGLEEVRLSSRPSFSEAAHAAYRAYAGVDIPSEVKGRACPSWKDLKDFPADRIVDDDYPLLKYYRWFWQHGDGWAGANDAASAAFAEVFGRKMVSMYAPVLRMPYLWGIGGHNSHLHEWIYLNPNPAVARYQIAEMQAAGRGTGAAVVSGIDGIVRMVWILPDKKNKPTVLPDWYKAHEGVEFATIPPDWASEAFWLMFSRRTDGIGLAVGPAIVGLEPGERYWAPKTNDATLESLRGLMRDVAVPLGPLFRNMPERAPEVAILGNHAAVIFSGTAPWDWTTDTRRFGALMTLVNLDQYVLFDEEIERDGIPPSVKAILMPECEVLTKKTAEKLRAFQARGGRLIAAATLAPGLKADATLPSWSEAYFSSKKQGREGTEVDRAMRSKAAEVKALLGFPLYADADNDAILVSVRSLGSGDVVFAVNDKRGYGDYFGPWKTVLDKGLPNAGEVRLRRTAGAVYDLVRHGPVPFACADGITRIPVSYETCDGKALLVTARPLAPLAVSTDGKRLVVSSPDKDVMVPFGVRTATGKLVVSGILREGAWERPLPPEAFEVVNYVTGARHPVR